MWLFPITQPPLVGLVDFLWLSESYAQAHTTELILPTGTIDVVIDLAAAKICRSVVSGIQSRAVPLDTSGPLSLIGARFRPGGARALLGIPAGELHNCAVSPETIWGHEAVRLSDRLHATSQPLGRFQLLEQFLTDQLSGSSRPSGVVRCAVEAVHKSPRGPLVTQLAEQSGMRAVRFANLFRDEVGVTPKSYCRIVRFRRAIDSICAATSVDWTSIALDSNYYDQAHFNHDFRELAGMAPSEYLQNRTEHPNHVRARD